MSRKLVLPVPVVAQVKHRLEPVTCGISRRQVVLFILVVIQKFPKNSMELIVCVKLFVRPTPSEL